MKFSDVLILITGLTSSGLAAQDAPFVNLMTPTLQTYSSQTEEQAA